MQTQLALTDFAKKADALMSSDPCEGFFSLKDHFKHLLFETDLLKTVSLRELQNIAADPSHQSAAWEPNYIVLAGGPLWQLRVGLYTRSSNYVYTLPQHLMVAVVGSLPLQANVYRLPEEFTPSIFNSAIRLSQARRQQILPGQIAVIDGRKDVFDVLIEAPVLTAKLSSSIRQPLQWAFDRDTMLPVQAIAANPIDSELVSMAKVLGALKCATSSYVLAELARHESHFVRWAAMQALGQVAPDTLLPILRLATDDPHPHISRVAGAALRSLVKE